MRLSRPSDGGPGRLLRGPTVASEWGLCAGRGGAHRAAGAAAAGSDSRSRAAEPRQGVADRRRDDPGSHAAGPTGSADPSASETLLVRRRLVALPGGVDAVNSG